MARIFITLKSTEREALRVLAEREERDPRRQAALLLREALENRGLLPTDAQPASKATTATATEAVTP